jgi:hypothetical protein
MIRKPVDWQPPDDGAAVRTVRTAAAVATQVRRGGVTAAALVPYAIVIFVGIMAIANGLATSLPGLAGIGAMAAGIYWIGRRIFAKG